MSRLSKYFDGIATKRLSEVEANLKRSNQHEINGIVAMKDLFGYERKTFNCDFIYLGMEEDDTITAEGILTWYDARKDNPSRTEYRLYYSSNEITTQAKPSDLLIIGKRDDERLLFLIISNGSTYEKQAHWLFGIDEEFPGFRVKEIKGSSDPEIGYTERIILETLGIQVDITDSSFLDLIMREFGEKFPTTKLFSEFARNSMKDISSLDNPDLALIKWLEREEVLFRTLEEHLVEEKILNGFSTVDEFISFSLSIQNRRKARAGYALENHLEKIFTDYGIQYSSNKTTENKSKPDFIFPGISYYHNSTYPAEKLTLLGAKSTCKDRWRQVLAEAKRIENKHLITLEPGISEFQTDEMIANKLQLVLPNEIHKSYSSNQREWLIDISDFLNLVQRKQPD